MSQQKQPDFMKMLTQYSELKPGPKAELRRVAEPEELAEVSAFYKLLQGYAGNQQMKGVIYCIPAIGRHQEGISVGQALAKAKVSEKRLFMVIRSEFPNDLIQLRRLLKMIEPDVDWPVLANSLYWWTKKDKQKILEDYFFYQNNSDSTTSAA